MPFHTRWSLHCMWSHSAEPSWFFRCVAYCHLAACSQALIVELKVITSAENVAFCINNRETCHIDVHSQAPPSDYKDNFTMSGTCFPCQYAFWFTLTWMGTHNQWSADLGTDSSTSKLQRSAEAFYHRCASSWSAHSQWKAFSQAVMANAMPTTSAKCPAWCLLTKDMWPVASPGSESNATQWIMTISSHLQSMTTWIPKSIGPCSTRAEHLKRQVPGSRPCQTAQHIASGDNVGVRATWGLLGASMFQHAWCSFTCESNTSDCPPPSSCYGHLHVIT